jgi:hypothetical protein
VNQSGERGVIDKATASAVTAKQNGVAVIGRVAGILERELQHVITDWHFRVKQEPDLTCIALSFEERAGHLPRFLHEVIARLRLNAGTKAPISEAAGHHGKLRWQQGYTVAMMVEELRLLQVGIFTILHENVKHLELTTLLPNIVMIADEVDAQLKQQVLGFLAADMTKLVR